MVRWTNMAVNRGAEGSLDLGVGEQPLYPRSGGCRCAQSQLVATPRLSLLRWLSAPHHSRATPHLGGSRFQKISHDPLLSSEFFRHRYQISALHQKRRRVENFLPVLFFCIIKQHPPPWVVVGASVLAANAGTTEHSKVSRSDFHSSSNNFYDEHFVSPLSYQTMVIDTSSQTTSLIPSQAQLQNICIVSCF